MLDNLQLVGSSTFSVDSKRERGGREIEMEMEMERKREMEN